MKTRPAQLRSAQATGLFAATALLLVSASVFAAPPTIDGVINPTTEGWLLLTESGAARPVFGGSATTSDADGESSGFHWWEGVSQQDIAMFDNRGDVINLYVAWDAATLYLAVAGPTAPFNSFADNGAAASNDVGDLFIAIDAAGGPAAGALPALAGHSSYGAKAVDFLGWQPTHVVAVQFVDNGGGGGGGANVEATVTNTILAGEGQGLANGGFDWNATINSAAAYDSVNNNAGEFEFAVPWALIGLPGGPATAQRLRLALYVTQNFGGSDVYDSGPGVGNGTLFEELGDCPGDPDTGGQLGACDPGSSFGSTAGANYVASLTSSPGPTDEIDTIQEYLSWWPCPGDFDGNGIIDAQDLALLLSSFGTGAGGDIDDDGDTDAQDLALLLARWGSACP